MNLKETAKQIRLDTVSCIGHLGVGHVGGCLSMPEVLAALYFKHMNIDPKNPKKEGRDRLIVSKGHAGPAVYSALANRGYFDKSLLLTLNQGGTNLPSHCDMHLTTGIDMTTGSLGQGFSCAVGAALGSKLAEDGATIFTIIGDGESQEGVIWEAAMFAAHQKLSNLIAFTDYNKQQLDGSVAEINSLDPLDKKWQSFGWEVYDIDGHDTDAIDNAIASAKNADKPVMILLNTVKGKGVAFVEAKGAGNHNMPLSPEETALALDEIRRG